MSVARKRDPMTATTFHPEQRTVETSAGPCPMPIHYHDGSVLALFYRVDPESAAALLAETPFEPLPFGGRGLAILAAFEYRETSIGQYNEVGLAIWSRLRGTRPSRIGLMINPRKQPEQAALIVHLPVTTEAAHAAGRELWGYPKYIAPIRTRFAPEAAEISLDGEFHLRVPSPRGVSLKGMPFVLFSVLEGRVLRTIVEVSHRVRWGLGRRAELEIVGDGPTVGALRALGIEKLAPTAFFRTDGLRSVLPLGSDLGKVG